jgi:hypothetical protein
MKAISKAGAAEAEAISKAPTNNSMSKSLYSFPKNERFGNTKAPM